MLLLASNSFPDDPASVFTIIGTSLARVPVDPRRRLGVMGLTEFRATNVTAAAGVC